nr:DUF2490 domain-containing protein [Allomuricauda sp.]
MTISFTKWHIGLWLCVLPIVCLGQESFTAYWQPQVALNYRVSQTYSHNFSLAHRAYLVDQGDSGFRGRQLDLVHFSKWNLQDNQSFAFGIQYRFRDLFESRPDELRLTQQYNITRRPMVIRSGHRIRSEQRITRRQTIHRFRYRFAVDFPLQGEKLDVGEAFLVASYETLLSIAKGSAAQYDGRLNGQIGWKCNKGLRLLFGMEYRLEDFTGAKPQNILFFLSSAQLSL